MVKKNELHFAISAMPSTEFGTGGYYINKLVFGYLRGFFAGLKAISHIDESVSNLIGQTFLQINIRL